MTSKIEKLINIYNKSIILSDNDILAFKRAVENMTEQQKNGLKQLIKEKLATRRSKRKIVKPRYDDVFFKELNWLDNQ